MELQCSSFQFLCAFSLFMIMVLKIAKRGKTKYTTTSNLPPGPRKLPIIGNIHQLMGHLPHHGLRQLGKKYGPIIHIRLGEIPIIVVSSSEIAKEVMTTHDLTLAYRPHVTATKIMSYDSSNVTFAPYGEYWRKVRKICMLELLTPKRVQSFRPIRENEACNLSKWIASRAGSPINLSEQIFSSTYSVTSQAALGKKYKDQQKFIYVVKEVVKAAAGFALADVFPSVDLLHRISGLKPHLERLHREAEKMMEIIIKEHEEDMVNSKTGGQGDVQEDLVDVLLKFHNLGGSSEFSLTTDNIKALIFDILAAGSETSATAVEWAMSELVKNPTVMKKAQDEVREVFDRKGHVDETGIREMKYLKLVIKETLRLHPSIPLLLPRECNEKCEIVGYDIPVKTKLLVNVWAMGRDPKYWTEPERFYPERFLDCSIEFKGTNFEYIPFGAGRRICPGMSYGLANVELPIANFLYHFDWKPPNGKKHEDLDMTEAYGLSVHRKNDLYLIPIPYHPPEKCRVQES